MRPNAYNTNQAQENTPPTNPTQQHHHQQQQQPAPKREFHISQATKDRANACKAYIERNKPLPQSIIICNREILQAETGRAREERRLGHAAEEDGEYESQQH